MAARLVIPSELKEISYLTAAVPLTSLCPAFLCSAPTSGLGHQYLEGVSSPDCFVVATGNPVLRQRWQQVLESAVSLLCEVVHPCACVSPSAQLDPGSVVLAGAVVNADARLDRAVLVNSSDIVDKDVMRGAYGQLGVIVALLSWSWHQALPI